MFMVTKSLWSFHHSTHNRCLQVSKCLFKPSTSLSPKTLAFFSQDSPSSSKFNSKTFYLIPTFFSVQFFLLLNGNKHRRMAPKLFCGTIISPWGFFEPREKNHFKNPSDFSLSCLTLKVLFRKAWYILSQVVLFHLDVHNYVL